MDKYYKFEQFTGGIADGSRAGYESGYQDGIGADFRSDPDQLTALKKLKKDSGSTVTDLVKWMKEYLGDVWMYGDTGKIYKRTSAGTYSNPKTVSGSTGQGLEIFNNELWYSTNDGIGKATDLQASTVFHDDYLKSSTTDYISGLNQTAANTYTIPTSITENATNKRDFTPTVTYVSEIMVNIVTVSTGDITCTVHDASNNVIAIETITNSNLAVAEVRFRFNGGFTVTASQTYHFHLTASGGSTTVRTNTASDLATVRHIVVGSQNDLDVDLRLESSSYSYPNSYAPQTVINETATNFREFVPTTTKLSAISLLVFERGTAGSWQITVHDENNTVIGQTTAVTYSTISDARCQWYKFSFATPVRLNPGQTYHFHITKPTAGTVLANTASNGSTVFYRTHFPVLETDTKWHTMKVFQNLLCIGNGNHLATLDDSEVYEPEALTFPIGESVRAIETIGDFVAVSTWRGANIASYGSSRLYLWDGVSDTFNAFLDIDGQTNALVNTGNNKLMIVHGTVGMLSVYTGGITPLRRLKGVGENKTVEIYPGAVTTWEGLVYMGISDGTSTALDRVVHAYGRKDKDYANALTKDYPISTGNKGATVQIGATLGIAADKFFVSWKDSSTYGVDIIDTANDQTDVFVNTLRLDDKSPNLEKTPSTISIRCAPLTSGQSIEVYWRKNNSGSFTLIDDAFDTVNGIVRTYAIQNVIGKFLDLELQIRLKTSGANAPTLLSVTMDFETKPNLQLGDITT